MGVRQRLTTALAPTLQAPRPSTGPHKLRECLPLVLILRNRLKYALTNKEVQTILMQRLVKVDGKVITAPESNACCCRSPSRCTAEAHNTTKRMAAGWRRKAHRAGKLAS